MTTKLITLLIVFCIAATGTQLFAQNRVSARFLTQLRTESQLSYSFFTGPDAGDFTTSVKGFGSGILDFFASRSSIDILQIGTEKQFISIGAGFAVRKYRLADNLVFSKSSEGTLLWEPDPDITHNYVNTFFGYGKTKIITTSFYFPVDLNISFGEKVSLAVGGYVDLNLTARYKMKYKIGDDKVTEIIRSSEFRNFNPSTTKFGISAAIAHKKTGLGICGTYCITPFFQPGMGPDIREASISLSYRLRSLNGVIKKKGNPGTGIRPGV